MTGYVMMRLMYISVK